MLEHEYILPKEHEVSDAIEIATLFIGTVNNVLSNLWDIDIGNEENMYAKDRTSARTINEIVPRTLNAISLRYNERGYDVLGFANRQILGDIKILSSDSQYLEVIRLIIAVSMHGNIENALYDLLQSINCSIPENMVKVKTLF